MLLEEFDSAAGVIGPDDTDMQLSVEVLPATLIAPFAGELLAAIVANPNCRLVGYEHSINGSMPIYIYTDGDREFTVMRAELGAPACVGGLEEVMARGVQQVIIFGSCGVLDRQLRAHQIIMPTSAMRDEARVIIMSRLPTKLPSAQQF